MFKTVKKFAKIAELQKSPLFYFELLLQYFSTCNIGRDCINCWWL